MTEPDHSSAGTEQAYLSEIEKRKQIVSLLSEFFPGKQWYRDLAAKAIYDRIPGVAQAVSDPVGLEDAIRTAETMLSQHIEEFHDFDYEPHQVPLELQQLRNIQHHLLGTLVEIAEAKEAHPVQSCSAETTGQIVQRVKEACAQVADRAVARYSDGLGNAGRWSMAREIAASIRALIPADEPQAPSTPAAKWRQQGLPDPHMTRYDCERGHLMMGHLTDDEMANAVFLNNSDIATLTAAKDRIRWLSRQLEAALERDRQSDATSSVSRLDGEKKP